MQDASTLTSENVTNSRIRTESLSNSLSEQPLSCDGILNNDNVTDYRLHNILSSK